MSKKELIQAMRSRFIELGEMMNYLERSEDGGKTDAIATITIDIDREGRIVGALENGEPLFYGKGEECKKGEFEEDKRMDDKTTHLRSNPCCWKKIGKRWYCIPTYICCP